MGNLGKGKIILIVDDYRVIRELLARYLERSGFATCIASDGRAAFEAFQREEPNFLISELKMPHMNGFELTGQVRAISNVPILSMTAVSGSTGDDKKEATHAGVDAFQ